MNNENEESIDNYKKTIEILESEKKVLKDELRKIYMDTDQVYKENFKLREEIETLKMEVIEKCQ